MSPLFTVAMVMVSAVAAVDSAAIDPSAVTKTLRPLLEVNYGSDFVGVNREEPVTGSDVFGVHAPVEFDDTFDLRLGAEYRQVEGRLAQ